MITLAALLIGYTLTVSPFSATYHFTKVTPETPRHIGSNDFTYHPGFSLLFQSKNMQASAFYLNDTFANHAGGAAVGPKWNLFKHMNVGLLGGLYVRPDSYKDDLKVSVKRFGVELVPLMAITMSFNIPLTDNVGIGLSTIVTPLLINQQIGLTFSF